jgi:hypothetical protein
MFATTAGRCVHLALPQLPMPCELRWKTSLSASCIHAATCVRAGIAAADPQLAEVIDVPATDLVDEIRNVHWPLDDVLPVLASLSAEFENNRELVKRAVARLRISTTEQAMNQVAGAIADVEAALRRHQPEIVDELELRSGPLRQQWHARGPGMLIEAARVTDQATVPAAAEAVLVSPYAGGHGTAHAAQNRVVFEAVLVNPLPAIPETVRLGWLVGQLNADLPAFTDVMPPMQSVRALRWAMLAPALAAGEAVELCVCDEATMDAAIDGWRLREELPADAATQIWQWWRTWMDGSGIWPVAVAVLDGMLRG